jgi:P4 family phage/plasmid primase-like protien
MITLDDIARIFGDNHFKLCRGKRAVDANLYNLETAKTWVSQGGTVGLWCPEGFVIIDIDDQEQASCLDKASHTLKCKTPHGMHFYYKTDHEIRQAVKAHTPIGLICDTRVAEKGYALLPFNCEDRGFIEGEVEDLPFWIEPLNIPQKSDAFIKVGAKDGDGRNDAMLRQLMRLRTSRFDENQIRYTASLINQYVWKEPLSAAELGSIIEHALGYAPLSHSGKPDFKLYNDKGTATAINHKALVDYIIAEHPMFVLGNTPYVYLDGVFKPNALYVKDLIKQLIDDPKFQKQNQITEIYKLLTEDIRLCFDDNRCNPYKQMINFKNGMFDIETQQLYPHNPCYLSTIQIPHNYMQNSLSMEDIQLMDFLRQTRLPADDIAMIVDFIAYCMTTSNGMKCFMCLVGGSDTGKSTLIKMIEALVGYDNISNLSVQDMSKRFYPARLKDKLVNSCADNSSLALDDIGNLKKITGDDRIMYEDKGTTPFFFTPFAKLIFSFNTMPLQLEEKSDAFYNRIRILEMSNKIQLNQRYVDDFCSDESIEAMIPVLCHRLKNMKKIYPSSNSIKRAEKLRDDSDSIHAYMTTLLQRTNLYSDVITQDALYDEYVRFCLREERPSNKRNQFFRSLESIDVLPMQTDTGYVYAGWKFKNFSKTL